MVLKSAVAQFGARLHAPFTFLFSDLSNFSFGSQAPHLTWLHCFEEEVLNLVAFRRQRALEVRASRRLFLFSPEGFTRRAVFFSQSLRLAGRVQVTFPAVFHGPLIAFLAPFKVSRTSCSEFLRKT